MEKKKKFKMPHAYMVIVAIIVFCTILTWILPAGSFERIYDAELDREIVVAGSYQQVEGTPVGPWQAIIDIFLGLIDAADIIFFIVFATAYVQTLTKTGALNAFIGAVLRMTGGKKDHLLIPVFVFLFALGGTTFGMYEELFALVPAFMVIMVSLGYDKITGGAVVFLGAGAGSCAAILNPFTVGIASSIAQVPLTGPVITPFRIILFVVFVGIVTWYIMHYASKLKKDITKSPLYGTEEWDIKMSGDMLTRQEIMELEFTKQNKISLVIFLIMIACIAYGVITMGWYLNELSAIFVIFMVITGIVNRVSAHDLCEWFVEAAENSMFAALLIGLSRSLQLIMTDANIIDTVVYYLSNLIIDLPKSLGAIGMLVIQNLINFFIPSGSGQAVVTMPVMAPIADVTDMSRQIAVTAYHMGDDWSNTIWPTACATECGIMGISMGRWYKFMLPLFGILFASECVLMLVGLAMGI